MERKGIVTVIIILVVLIGGILIFANMERAEREDTAANDTPPASDEVRYPQITQIDAKHFFIDGMHTLAGEITFPTPCDLLDWDVTVAESFPEQVTVSFSVTNYAETCAQVLTQQRFKVDFEASEEATIRARFEGRPIELNLIPALPGESPDDFELFIKG